MTTHGRTRKCKKPCHSIIRLELETRLNHTIVVVRISRVGKSARDSVSDLVTVVCLLSVSVYREGRLVLVDCDEHGRCVRY